MHPIYEADPLYETCEKNLELKYYGYRDGKRTVEDENDLVHIAMNIGDWRCLLPLQTLTDMKVSEILVEMFQHAAVLCHELAHAFMLVHYDVDEYGTPPMNDEIMIETGFSLENFMFDALTRRGFGGEPMSLLQWPSELLHNAYSKDARGEPIEITKFGDGGPDRWMLIDSLKIERFLKQSFWDDPNPPVGHWKKMWLRPHINFVLDKADWKYHTTGDTPPFMPEAKRRRFSDATKERQRVQKANEKWKNRMQQKFRWHRSQDLSEERKAEFHEKEMGRLNELWAECTKGLDGQVIPK